MKIEILNGLEWIDADLYKMAATATSQPKELMRAHLMYLFNARKERLHEASQKNQLTHVSFLIRENDYPPKPVLCVGKYHVHDLIFGSNQKEGTQSSFVFWEFLDILGDEIRNPSTNKIEQKLGRLHKTQALDLLPEKCKEEKERRHKEWDSWFESQEAFFSKKAVEQALLKLIEQNPRSLTGFSTVPPKRGIYWIATKTEVLYIGMSENLHERLKRHTHLSVIQKFEDVNFGFVVFSSAFSRNDILAVEAHFIKLVDPLCNKKEGKYKSQNL